MAVGIYIVALVVTVVGVDILIFRHNACPWRSVVVDGSGPLRHKPRRRSRRPEGRVAAIGGGVAETEHDGKDLRCP